MKLIFNIFIFLFTCILSAQNAIHLIPAPQHLEVKKGTFVAPEIMPVYLDSKFLESDILYNAINNFVQVQPVSKAKKAKHGIAIVYDIAIKNKEAYSLEISKNGIKIHASAANGVFYALQTIKQLRKDPQSWSHDGKDFQKRVLGNLPALKITDNPAYQWRGMHLDESRHFFGVEKVKKYLDLMAMHKMNVFHWHLTDDQGWRIQIRKYPKLTEIGAWRNGSMVGKYKDHKIDSIRYGGFYTQQEIKEIVGYAKRLFITVLPEIEMPGHSQASMAAYPQYSCNGIGPFEVAKQWGGFDDPYCAGNDSAFLFLQDILSEVFEMFPSQYIHIGGDECPKSSWKKCKKCQDRIVAEGLKDEFELQSYFIRRMEKYLNGAGRYLIGWDEILEGGLAPNAAVMSWRGTEGGLAAAKAGHYVVMSPGKPLYFDHYQSKDSTEPIAIGGFNPLEDVYKFNPLNGLDTASGKFVLGAQANVWTEYMADWVYVEYMVFPRQCALADALWKGADRANYSSFLEKLPFHFKKLDALNVNYYKNNIIKKQ